MSLRILLADDQQLVRDGIKALLEQERFEVVGAAVNGEEAVQLAQALNPDVAVLDLIMPAQSGVAAGEQILRHCPCTHVLLLTMHSPRASGRGGPPGGDPWLRRKDPGRRGVG